MAPPTPALGCLRSRRRCRSRLQAGHHLGRIRLHGRIGRREISGRARHTLSLVNPFPPTSRALREPNGLLAVGGDLQPETLISAYAQGIFPWFNEGEDILWWSPDPRLVLRTAEVHISRSMRKALKTSDWTLATTMTLMQSFIIALALTVVVEKRARGSLRP